jgi:hypothetical protein
LHGKALRSLSLSIYQVHDGLGLSQVKTAIEKGTQGKFARVSHTRTLRQDQTQDTLEDEWTSMSLNLYNVFTGIGTGGLHKSCKYLIHYLFSFWINHLTIGE